LKISYDTGRLDLPFVGISTFAKRPYEADWDKIDADVAIIGAPFDGGTQFRPGARFGPRAVREASTLFSFGHAGAYDHEDDAIYLGSETKIIDMGDADIVHTDTKTSHANIDDAHLDFVDERHGVRNGHGNPMRRAAEKDNVTGLTQVGIRNVSSTAKEGYEDARKMGSDILSVTKSSNSSKRSRKITRSSA